MALAAFWFSLMNVFVKKVSHLPVMELVFFRCSISSLFCFGGIAIKKIDWVGTNRRLLLARGFFGTTALALYFLTVKHMPLGTAVSIQYISPIFSIIVAALFFREKIKPVQIFFFFLSFIGVLLIKGFDPRVSAFYLGIGLLSALGSSLAYNMIRSLSGKEHPLVVVLHFQLLAAITGLIFSLFKWNTPIGIEWIYLLFIGVFTQLAQMAMTRSLQKDKIANVSIMNYTGIIYALLFGYFLFDEKHDALAIVGMFLIVAGVVLNIIFSQKEKKLSSSSL